MTPNEENRLANRFEAGILRLEDKLDAMHTEFSARLGALETLESERRGRNSLLKLISSAIGTAAATIAIYLGLKDA